MPDLPRVEWDTFKNPQFEDASWISLLRATDSSTQREVGLRVATRMIEKSEPRIEHAPWVWKLEEEAQELYFLREAGLSVPRFIGLGNTDGIKTPLEVDKDSYYATNYAKKIDDGLPFYAREWIKGDNLGYVSFDNLLRFCGNSFLTQAIDFGELFENRVNRTVNHFFDRYKFVLENGSKKIVHVKPNRLFIREDERGDKSDLYTILDFLPKPGSLNIPHAYYQVEMADISSLPEPYRSLIEDIKAGKFQSFADLRKPVLDALQVIADQQGYARDPRTGLYHPKSEIPLVGQEVYLGGNVMIIEPEKAERLRQSLRQSQHGVPTTTRETYTLPERKAKKPHVNRRNGIEILNLLDEMYNDDTLWCLGGPALSLKEAIEQGKDPTEIYNDIWKTVSEIYPHLSSEERKVSDYLERLDTLFNLSPSFAERVGELVLNGKYSPVRLARRHPGLAYGGLGVGIAELSQMLVPNLVINAYEKILFDSSSFALSAGINYAIDVIRGTGNVMSNTRKALLSLPTAAIGGLLYLSSLSGIFPVYNTQPAQQPTPIPTMVPTATATFLTPTIAEPIVAPTTAPISTPIPSSLTYFGDLITGESIQPKKGTYIIESLGYDKSGNPFLLLNSDGMNIFVPYAGLGRDQFDNVYQKLVGREMTLTRDPVREYRADDLHGYVFSPNMIRVDNQTLLEALK